MRLRGGTVWLCGALTVCAAGPQDQPPTFKVGTDVVVSAVVVNDAQGHPVGSLKAEDFEIFDKGKPQKINSFEVEHLIAAAPPAAVTAAPVNPAATPEPAAEPVKRFIAYVFDDLQLRDESFIRLVEAARAHMTSLRPGDHAAIFTTSGAGMIRYTTHPEELKDGLNHLTPAKAQQSGTCPEMTYFDADLILNKKDHDAIAAAYYEMATCGLATTVNFNNLPFPGQGNDNAGTIIAGSAKTALVLGQRDARTALESLKNVVRNLAAAPGQRLLVLASPGFVTTEESLEMDKVIDEAVRNAVVINSLDARGLYADPGLSIKKHAGYASGALNSFPYASVKSDLATRAAHAQSGVQASLADATGGTFFESNNDLQDGFRQVSHAPDYVYLIGFTPDKLKANGEFHALKVQLKNHPELKIVAARKGYSAAPGK